MSMRPAPSPERLPLSERQARNISPARSERPASAFAADSAGGEDEVSHNFQVCDGYYAICAASTCSTTGKTIKVGNQTFLRWTVYVRFFTAGPSPT